MMLNRIARALGVGLIVVVAAPVAPTLGQELPGQVAQCRSVSDSLQRLTCYDSIELPGGATPVTKSGEYQVIELDIFKVDKDAMGGEKIEVSGTIMQMGEMIMLTNGQMDSNPIMVDAASVPRDQRLSIVQRCDMGCRAVVQGEVGSVFFQAGILASSIAIR